MSVEEAVMRIKKFWSRVETTQSLAKSFFENGTNIESIKSSGFVHHVFYCRM